MELFVLFSIASYHLFFSHAPYNLALDLLGKLVHPILFGGAAVLLAGAILFFRERKNSQKV